MIMLTMGTALTDPTIKSTLLQRAGTFVATRRQGGRKERPSGAPVLPSAHLPSAATTHSMPIPAAMVGHQGSKFFLLVVCQELAAIQLILSGLFLNLILDVPDLQLLFRDGSLVGAGFGPKISQFHSLAEELVPQGTALCLVEGFLLCLDLSLLVFSQVQSGRHIGVHTKARPHPTPTGKGPNV